MPSNDYPRMLFHRTKEPVTVQSRDEEDALGREWSRTIWTAAVPAAPEPAPAPEPERDTPEPDPEPEEEVSPEPPRRPAKPPLRTSAAAKVAKKKQHR